MPDGIDREGQPITYKVYEEDKKILPSFANFDAKTKELIFSPKKSDKPGEY